MLFGEYFQNKSEYFQVDDVCVLLEPMPLGIFERHIIGVDDSDHSNMIKYRVTFRYPRSKTKAKNNSYDEEIKYVLASSVKDAKDRIEQFVHNRRMKTIGGIKSDQPAEYLAAVNRNRMEMKVKAVTSWQDFVDLCAFVAKKKPQNPVRYFNQHDLSIFIKKYRHSADFAEQLQKLPKEVQLLMKRVYFHVINGDLSHDNHSELQKGGKYAPDLKMKDVLGNYAKRLGRHYPKPVIKDADEELPVLHSVAEVLQQAKAYGISYKQLKEVKNQLMFEYDPMFQERVAAYQDLRAKLTHANYRNNKNNFRYRGKGGISTRNSMFDGSDELSWDKYGADTWVDDIAREYPWLNSQEKMFDFYKRGMPKMAPALDLWSRALERVIEYKKQEKHNSHEIPTGEIPF
jgi:hypothetical protein